MAKAKTKTKKNTRTKRRTAKPKPRTIPPAPTEPAGAEWYSALARSRPRRWRTVREFVEAEIIIPDGPYRGRPFDCSRQPYTAHLFDAYMGPHRRMFTTGPSQSGKTLSASVVPVLYHLFEIGETVIYGVPTADIVADKWSEDIRPVIEASGYRDWLPKSGQGSRGGTPRRVQFGNGATLRFMTGGGSDKARAAYTARVVVVTETDGFDEVGATSREADKFAQLEARTRAYGNRARIYAECTVSTEQGRTWREITEGTASRLLLPCPHCRALVLPEREHLTGWAEADTIIAARTAARWSCPACAKAWTPAERVKANHHARLVHRGQDVAGSEVTGEPAPTDTLGFRWAAIHNLFTDAAQVGADEWRGARATDEQNAERELCQFIHATPYTPPDAETVHLTAEPLTRRAGPWPRGQIAPDAVAVTMGVDVGKWRLHWLAVSWQADGSGHIHDYGTVELETKSLGPERAIGAGLLEVQGIGATGWAASGGPRGPDSAWIDAGWQPAVVYQFTKQANPGRFTVRAPAKWLPAKGYGATTSNRGASWYSQPRAKTQTTRIIGEGYHLSRHRAAGVVLAEFDADRWKSWAHERLAAPVGEPGAMTLYAAPPRSHHDLARHLTAEHAEEQFTADRGRVVRWIRDRRRNHWLDCLTQACAAGHYCGVRLLAEAEPAAAKPAPAPRPRPTRDAAGWFAARKRKGATT